MFMLIATEGRLEPCAIYLVPRSAPRPNPK